MKHSKITPIALLVGLMFCNAAQAAEAEAQTAAEQTGTLEQVKVKGRRSAPATVERVNAKTIQQELIRDTRDLVRYSADVGVADQGRRLKGFAMRGVEDNRVGISIDGVSLPSSEENSLYARYGNFNNSRLSIDTELVKGVDITKGADSFDSGSGSLGGNVNYRTLDAGDIVSGDRHFGGLLRSGYASKNREWVNTVGFGYVGEKFDALALFSHRHGHEMKSRGGKGLTDLIGSSEKDKQDQAERGSTRIKPDPMSVKNNSYLFKFGWSPIENHRFALSVNGQNNHNFTDEKTYSLTQSWREADDVQKRKNVNLSHEWTPDAGRIALVKTDLDYQKTRNGAINYKGDMNREGDWRSGYTYTKGFLADRDERNMDTRYKRFSLRIDSQSLSLFNTKHRLSFKTFISRRDFENVNHDMDFSKGQLTGESVYTIMRPMKTDQIGFSLQDGIDINSRLSMKAGIRYDHEKVKPQAFRESVPCKDTCVDDGNPSGKSFNTWNGVLGMDYRLNDTWKIGYQLGSGHRIPTASEMYFTYNSVYGNWIANPNLKAERSINQTLSLQGKNEKGLLDFNIYHTKYRNFLFEEESTFEARNEWYYKPDAWYHCYHNPALCGPTVTTIGQQMVNIDRAKVYGLELKGSLNLHKVLPVSEGWKFSGSLGYSKGKLSGDSRSMLSIQPIKAILGLDYESPDDRWGVFSRVTFMGRKKAKDAQISEQDRHCVRHKIDPWTGEESEDCDKYSDYYAKTLDYRWLNKAATVVDVFGYYKPAKKLILRAGVYNLFNRKYHTWDSLRGINPRATINSLSVSDPQSSKQGLERFYAPGRNYAVSLEWKF
ncbi:TonB-dependent hemoglobin/transferrin/lactoferrin family receptor [Neisseria sp. WLZKY-1]|jgi:tonB-dependent hemoglobin/transferrin/lactoferrin receptor family protein|uniref:TonB-dependent hemoglobin/transferrin/lactoferrin family receptor n=1 Tax=Neisseria sp. WLZKY-1 TaxID=3390377 RepID=UPI00397C285B